MKTQSRILSATLTVAFLVLVVFGVAHVQAIEDWYRLRGYNLPAQLSTISAQDAMTPYAKHILEVTHPVLESDGQAFQQDCSQNEQTIVLGCYHSGVPFISSESTLFVYNVKDPRLAGVQQVTTAHEMLHAAYDRLSSKERAKVDAMLLDFYKNDLKDQRIIDTMNAYKQTEPNDVVNEMHSVFGTEIANLPAPLENYYKQYFTNRLAVTTYAANYEDEFTSRTNQINADDTKLAQMRQDIEAQETQLQAELSGLNADRASVERSNDPSAISDYNARVNSYNAGVRKLQSDIAAYNTLVEQRNSLASELRNLQQSLDSHLTTQPAQ